MAVDRDYVKALAAALKAARAKGEPALRLVHKGEVLAFATLDDAAHALDQAVRDVEARRLDRDWIDDRGKDWFKRG